ncbi:MAG: polysaccharide biosynthesis tyrosine autokinase [Acidobacteria bacterium]|nr:polysaccharide biosynthesis tyrosine autokinase [Acidobacteriota bacterium]
MSELDPQDELPPSVSAATSQPATPAPGSSGSYYGGAGSTRVFEGMHILDYVRILYKRRWTIAVTFLVVVVSVAAYSFTATPIYQSSAQLLIEVRTPNILSFKDVLEEERATTTYYQTQYSLLRSRSLAKTTIDALKLWKHHEFGGGRRGAERGWLARIRRAVRLGPAAVNTTLQQEAAAAAKETAGQSAVIDAFLNLVTVEAVRSTRLVYVHFRSRDPKLAADVANMLATNYIEQNMELKVSAAKGASEFLGDRLGEQRKQVEVSEGALQRYLEEHDTVSLDDRENLVTGRLSDLSGAVTKAKTERLGRETLYNQIRSIQNSPSELDTFPSILENSYIQKLRGEVADLQKEHAQLSDTLGERHPDLIRVRTALQSAEARLKSEIAKVVQSVRAEYMAAIAREQSLVSALEVQKREAMALNRTAIEYGMLKREADSNRKIYDTLLEREKETGLSGETRTNNIKVVDPAEIPRSPLWPKKARNLLLAILGGSLLGIGLAFFFEYLDNRIKAPEEIKTYLGLPFLGFIPVIGARGDVSAPLLNNGVPANFAEAFRSVRTNVLFSSAGEGTKSIVVTSTGPGEGKTLMASNLAVAIAQAGQRVLLIDADMRRPRIHDLFSIGQEPGLSNLMVGNAKASKAVQKSSVPGLWLLPSGLTPPNPAELLGSQQFKDFLNSLDAHFDWIVIDSPPVMAVTDASVVAHVSSGVLFVIGAEMTSRHAARAAIERLDGVHARFVGAVLNRVDLERNAYYYSHYYRRDYGEYYSRSAKHAART